MKLNNRIFSIVVAFSSFFNLGILESANANLKKSFKESKDCTFENATYIHPTKKSKRFCVHGKKVLGVYNDGLSASIMGVLGKQERGDYTFYATVNYYIDQLEIEGNELIEYNCSTDGPFSDCNSKPKRRLLGYKVGTFSTSPNKGQETKVSANSNSLKNGIHTYVFESGDKYTGNYVNGKRTGKGTYIWKNGDKYVGDWVDGEMTGKGSMTWKSGEKYTGNYVNGKRTGKGTYIWKNGDKYVGDFVNSIRTGKGTLSWIDGSNYVGDFVNGKLNGYGQYTDEKGRIYKGEFKNGKFVRSY